VPRIDIPAKVAGTYTHMQHVRVAGVLHGRVVRPRGQRAYGTGAKPLHIDEASIAGIPARVVCRGDFVGVVAEREWDAVKAARELKVIWQESAALPGDADLFTRMRAVPSTDTVIANIGDIAKGFAAAAYVEQATYRCPYQAHVPFGPNCAIADVGPDGALVMSSTQDIYNSRDMLAKVLDLPAGKVRVQYYEGSGTFGHSCYEDASQAAAILSQAVGRPVRVQFMRWDEHGWDNYGPAHLAEVRAAIDANGTLIAYEYHGWQHGWIVTENSHELALLSGATRAHVGRGLDPGQPDQHRLDVHDAQPARGEPRGGDGWVVTRCRAALASRHVVCFRVRANDRCARPRGADRSANLPPPQHRRPPLARRTQRGRGGRQLGARGIRPCAPERCRYRGGMGRRARHASCVVRGRSCSDRGQQAYGQHRS
jgi:hypothetical protein